MSRLTPSLPVALIVFLSLAACGDRPAPPPETTDPRVQTIEQATDLPPLPLPTSTLAPHSSASAAPLVDLPFTPAVSMDPVDGSKVSMRPDTPVAEFKDRLYYFRNEENRQAFLRNPEKYASGSLSRY